MVIQHPLGQDPGATANDLGQAALDLRQLLNQQASVDGLIVDALLAVLLDDVQKVVFPEAIDRAMNALEGLLHRHSADGGRPARR